MVKRARPAVVRIQSTVGAGSGVIFETQDNTAYVVTNHHVVEGQAEVSVTVNDSTTFRGTVLGADVERDLAVVKICCGSFQKLVFADASLLEPGDEVVVMGYPLGLTGEATITLGIVSAIRYSPAYKSDVIQTDAAINPGNSGGPMLSTSGDILGINTYRIDTSDTGRSAQGLGFAISERTVQLLMPTLRLGRPSLTRTPIDYAAPAPTADARHYFGPASGELRHDPSDAFIKTEYAQVSVVDMEVEAAFVNPYSAGSNSWDYGFILREESGGGLIYITVTSGRRWQLAWRDRPGAGDQMLGGGTIETLNTHADGQNHLRLVAVGERGWFFVNGEFVSTLNLSDHMEGGDVAVFTGAFEGDEVAGAVTRFENFRVNRLARRYGPTSGKIQQMAPGRLATHHSGVQARDMVVEAEFINPQSSNWICGFLIRNSAVNRAELIGLTGAQRWAHMTLDAEEYMTLAEGPIQSANFRGANRLLLLVFGDSGWYFVNDDLVAKLDLSHNQDSGWVSAIAHAYLTSQDTPEEFENFTVWSP